jgi:hypothetical protein
MSRKITKIEVLLNRFHPVVFISVAVLATALTVLIYYGVFLKAQDDSLITKNLTTTFDKSTIDDITKLHSSSDSTNNVTLPDSRYNPFIEK